MTAIIEIDADVFTALARGQTINLRNLDGHSDVDVLIRLTPDLVREMGNNPDAPEPTRTSFEGAALL